MRMRLVWQHITYIDYYCSRLPDEQTEDPHQSTQKRPNQAEDPDTVDDPDSSV